MKEVFVFNEIKEGSRRTTQIKSMLFLLFVHQSSNFQYVCVFLYIFIINVFLLGFFYRQVLYIMLHKDVWLLLLTSQSSQRCKLLTLEIFNRLEVCWLLFFPLSYSRVQCIESETTLSNLPLLLQFIFLHCISLFHLSIRTLFHFYGPVFLFMKGYKSSQAGFMNHRG